MFSFNKIIKAKNNISDYVYKTPLIKFNKDLYLKMESLHKDVKAFKVRGALNKMKNLSPECRKVVTAAVGSYGFAVGVIGKRMGIETICFIPKTATKEKKEKMKKLVDEVRFEGEEFSSTEKIAIKYAKNNNIPFLHPYNDEVVIAGQGTIGIEILEELPKVKNIYLPIGGGGMFSGVSVAVKHLNPKVRLIGVQPKVMSAMVDSVKKGRIVNLKKHNSLAEPLAVNLNPKAITFKYVKKNADDFVLVKEKEIISAMQIIYKKTGYVVEGAGAITLAAALKDKKRKGISVCVISGGNVSKDFIIGL